LNKIVSTKNTSAIFLAIVLVLGTIATISQSFILGAQAEPYYEMDDRYDSYEPDYSDRNNYEPTEYPSYQPDYKPEYPSDNSYKSKKDSSNSVSLNKLKCINNNVNINGNNTGNINVGNSGRAATGPGTDEGYLGVGSSGGNYGEGYDNGYKKQKDQGFTCIINNNNNNTNIVAGGGNITEPEPTATLAVSKTTRCDPDDSQAALEACGAIELAISPDDFNIVVTGNEPDPDEFPGSNTPPGVVVTLGAGDYQVTEELPDLPPLPVGVTVSRTTTFVGNCADVDPNDQDSIVAAGTIEAGESQICDIENIYETSTAGGLASSNINTDISAFDINTAGGLATSNINTGDVASSFSSPPTIAQGTEASSSALEKTEKLKQQWLDLLP
jgi:hypothetical protein